MEHRMRCRVCGKIWCFTDKDLKDNQSNSVMSGLAAIGGIASALGGTTAQQHLNYDIMERNQAKIVDYHQCPNCRSKDVVELSEEEWSEVQLQERFANTRVSINANATTEALLDRIKLLLEDKDWPSANAYCDAVLDAEPQNAMAYVYKLMAELRVSEQADLMNQKAPFDARPNYQKALRFADGGLQQDLKSYIVHINERNEQERLKGLYDNACAAMQQAVTEENYKSAAALFVAIKGYKDADSLQAECLKKAEKTRLEAERKAAEEKAAAAEQAKKTKKVAMIAAPIVIVAVVAAIILGVSSARKQAREQEMCDTYENAVEMMSRSIMEAYELLSDLPDDYEQVSELKETCAPYIPYCGNYPVGSNGNYFVSDFWLSAKGNMMWRPDFNDLNGTMSVFYMDDKWQPGCWGDLRDTHQFFRGGIGEPVSMSDGVMTCVSTAKDDGVSFTATVTFENGELYYAVVEDGSGQTLSEWTYTK